MGTLHARVFAAAAGARLEGVLDVDREAAARVARAYGARALGTFAEAVERADLVVVATPTPLHFAHAELAIAAGRVVLVEKPLAASAAKANALCDAARAHGVPLLVGHSERFNPVVRALVRETRDAEVTRVLTRRTAARSLEREDLCVNLAVHDIDIVALLARSPAALVGASGGADDAEIVLRAGSTHAWARVARGVAPRVRAIRVEASRASWEGDLAARSLLRDGAPVALDDLEPLALQASAALRACAGEPSAVAFGVDGARAVEVAERAAAQLADRARVSAAE